MYIQTSIRAGSKILGRSYRVLTAKVVVQHQHKRSIWMVSSHFFPKQSSFANQLLLLDKGKRGNRRYLSANGGITDDEVDSEIKQYLQDTLNVDEALHGDVIRTFESIYGKNNVTVEHLKSFDKEDMEALIHSIQVENTNKKKKKKAASNDKSQAQQPKRPTRSVLFKIPNIDSSKQEEMKFTWRFGESLLDVAKQNEDELLSAGAHNSNTIMEGVCGGNMNCSTCHVYINQSEFYNILSPPNETELDLLDSAYEPIEGSSRLGCQVVLNQTIIDHISDDDTTTTPLEITIPSDVNDLWTP